MRDTDGVEREPLALELRNVSAGYGRTGVLHAVTLAVPKASVVALLGSNGAGKTTLMRTASGLLKPTAGQVLLGGRNVTDLAPHARARAGLCLIPEGRGIFRNLTVRENLMMHLPSGMSRAVGRDRINEVTETLPILKARIDQIAGRLSGGEQQMLALARAYLSSPRVVLLDEVSMGLAPMIVDQIFTSFKTLAEKGKSLLVVEQYVHRALDFADEVVLLDRGEIAFSGAAQSLDTDRIVQAYLAVPA